jgi:hypothetical protein
MLWSRLLAKKVRSLQSTIPSAALHCLPQDPLSDYRTDRADPPLRDGKYSPVDVVPAMRAYSLNLRRARTALRELDSLSETSLVGPRGSNAGGHFVRRRHRRKDARLIKELQRNWLAISSMGVS